MCVHLSDFPTPRSDPPISTNTGNGLPSSSRHAATPNPACLSSGLNNHNNEDFLTPSSDVQREDNTSFSSCTTRDRARGVISSGLLGTTSATKPVTTTISVHDKTADSNYSNGSLSSVTIEKNAELRITKLIAIKHMLDLIQPLHDALEGTTSSLLKTYRDVSSHVVAFTI